MVTRAKRRKQRRAQLERLTPAQNDFMLCLLGLLIVPKEALIEKIPTADFNCLRDWGINPESSSGLGIVTMVTSIGRTCGSWYDAFEMQSPISVSSHVTRLKKSPATRFAIKADSMPKFRSWKIRALVTKLAQHLEAQA